MRSSCRIAAVLLFALASSAMSADWRQFRGPTGQGTSGEKELPVKWSADDHITWKVKLPGAGASSPIVLGGRIYITCYSGYRLDTKEPGNQEDLRRHLLCLNRKDGRAVWSKGLTPVLPGHRHSGGGP